MSYSSDKFSLNWNDFQQNIASSFNVLRNEPEFSDITLLCEDGQHIEAHRVILAICSPFFRDALKKSKHSHPMIYMRGVKAKDLVAILDYIYYGEVNLYQNYLDGFLALGKELQLKGLVDNKSSDDIKESLEEQPEKINIVKEDDNLHGNVTGESEIFLKCKQDDGAIVQFSAGKINVAADTTKEDLRMKVDSVMERIDKGEYSCTICGKATRGKDWIAKQHMRTHIESHIEGLSYPCMECGIISR